MKTSLSLAAAAAAMCAALAAPIATASADPGDEREPADVTIAGLQAEGYTVNIDKVGSKPLSECWVSNTRNPQENWGYYRDSDGDRHRYLISMTIQVSLAC